MSKEFQFCPFPQIPVDQDYEGKINHDLPTPSTTVFFSEPERLILQTPPILKAIENGTALPEEAPASIRAIWLANRLSMTRSKGRELYIDAIRMFIQDNYPENYAYIQEAMTSKIYQASGNQDKESKSLIQALAKEFTPPQKLRLKWIFQPHGEPTVKGLDIISDRTRNDLTSFYTPGENNIFIMEDSSGTGENPVVQDGLKYHKTLIKALAYTAAIGQLRRSNIRRKPSDEEVTTQLSYAESVLYSISSYLWVIADTIEGLYPKYPISCSFESARPTIGRVNIDYTSLDAYKDSLTRFDKSASDRNARVIRQIEQIEENVERSKLQTNVVIMLGTHHCTLMQKLPIRLGAVSTAVVRGDNALDEEDAICMLLREDKPVTEDQWQSAYKCAINKL